MINGEKQLLALFVEVISVPSLKRNLSRGYDNKILHPTKCLIISFGSERMMLFLYSCLLMRVERS